MKKTFFATILLVFSLLSGFFFWLKTTAPAYSFNVLMTGNILMAALSVITFIIVTKQIHNKPAAFVRGVYASSFLKLFICIIGIVSYAIINKPNVHKPSLFVLMGIYAVYSVIENWTLSRVAKEIR